jgi:hypothetical protein
LGASRGLAAGAKRFAKCGRARKSGSYRHRRGQRHDLGACGSRPWAAVPRLWPGAGSHGRGRGGGPGENVGVGSVRMYCPAGARTARWLIEANLAQSLVRSPSRCVERLIPGRELRAERCESWKADGRRRRLLWNRNSPRRAQKGASELAALASAQFPNLQSLRVRGLPDQVPCPRGEELLHERCTELQCCLQL